MYFAVTNVIPLLNYQLHLTFNNGEEKIFDMKPHLAKGIFQELKDTNLFNTVKVCFDTVEWANDADIDPETLYNGSIKI